MSLDIKAPRRQSVAGKEAAAKRRALSKKAITGLTLVSLGALAFAFTALRPGVAEPPASVTSAAENVAEDQPTVYIDGQLVTSSESDVRGGGAATRPLSTISLSKLSGSQISYVKTKGSRRVLVLMDGSERTLSDAGLAQLPETVRMRLSYERATR